MTLAEYPLLDRPTPPTIPPRRRPLRGACSRAFSPLQTVKMRKATSANGWMPHPHHPPPPRRYHTSNIRFVRLGMSLRGNLLLLRCTSTPRQNTSKTVRGPDSAQHRPRPDRRWDEGLWAAQNDDQNLWSSMVRVASMGWTRNCRPRENTMNR